MYKIRTTSKDSDDVFIGFDRSHYRIQRELNQNKNIKGKHHLRIYLEEVFGFAEHQRKSNFGLG